MIPTGSHEVRSYSITNSIAQVQIYSQGPVNTLRVPGTSLHNSIMLTHTKYLIKKMLEEIVYVISWGVSQVRGVREVSKTLDRADATQIS